MKPALTVLTLGVHDLNRAVAFYRDGLGWGTEGIIGTEYEHGAVAFFELHAGLKLALWPLRSLAHDTGRPAAQHCSGCMTLGHNVANRDEVDDALRSAQAAGATLIKPAQPTFYGGYAGYFADPDGHLWEVVHNPAFG